MGFFLETFGLLLSIGMTENKNKWTKKKAEVNVGMRMGSNTNKLNNQLVDNGLDEK